MVDRLASVLRQPPHLFTSGREVSAEIRRHNISIGKKTGGAIFAGELSGGYIIPRVAAADLLERSGEIGIAGLKDECYKEILAVGCSEREMLLTKNGTYGTQGFIESIARRTGNKSPKVRSALRAMRAEFTISQLLSNTYQVKQQFSSATDKYFQDHTEGKVPSLLVKALKQAWKGKTVDDFYRQLYMIMGDHRNSLALWTPYEVEVLDSFYEKRKLQGSRLSPFDIGVLNLHKNGDINEQDEEEGRSQSGVAYNKRDLYTHVRALTTGRL